LLGMCRSQADSAAVSMRERLVGAAAGRYPVTHGRRGDAQGQRERLRARSLRMASRTARRTSSTKSATSCMSTSRNSARRGGWGAFRGREGDDETGDALGVRRRVARGVSAREVGRSRASAARRRSEARGHVPVPARSRSSSPRTRGPCRTGPARTSGEAEGASPAIPQRPASAVSSPGPRVRRGPTRRPCAAPPVHAR
jgi:hypothetical protein